jgi:hypothetical protein
VGNGIVQTAGNRHDRGIDFSDERLMVWQGRHSELCPDRIPRVGRRIDDRGQLRMLMLGEEAGVDAA